MTATDTDRILAALESLDARLARLEAAIAPVADEFQPMVATVVDTVDGLIGQLQAQGIDVDTRLRASLSLAERMSRPQTAQNLHAAVDIAEDAPNLIATTVDTIDGLIAALQAKGIDVDARLHAGLSLAERLTRPQTLKNLHTALDIAEDAPSLIATTVDAVDSLIGQVQGSGIDLDARLSQLIRAAELLSNRDVIDVLEVVCSNSVQLKAALEGLLSSGVFGDEAVKVVGEAASAMVVAQEAAPSRIGAFALLRSLSDPDIARAVSFGREFARRFGQTLS